MSRLNLKSPLLAIFLVVLVDILGFTIVLPLLPFYFEKYGGTPAIYGTLVASFALCQLVAGPILGHLSDQYGRKPLLVLSQLGTFIGFIILGNATSLLMIFISRIIDGITAGNLSLAQAYISDVTEPKNRAKAFGIIGISFGLGFLVGPAISGFLSQYGFQYPAFAAAGLSFLSIMGTAFLLPEHKPVLDEEAKKARAGRNILFHFSVFIKYFQRKNLGPLLIEFFLFAIAFSLYISGFALFAERRFTIHGKPFGPREVGYLFAFSGFLGIIIQGGLLGRLVKKFGERKLVVIGFITLFLGYSGVGLTSSIGILLVVSAVGSFGTGILRPALTSLITQEAGRGEQGAILGLTQSITSVSQITAPLLSGYLINQSWLTPWAFAAGSMGLVGFLLSRRKPLPKPIAVPS